MKIRISLLPDTKLTKDISEYLVVGKFPGYFAKKITFLITNLSSHRKQKKL